LTRTGEQVLETVVTYLEHGRALESTARALFVHGNTVRYRLRSATEATGLDPTDPRHGYTIRMAIALGRLAEDPTPDL
jgi:DNA-binding PucR family transcriptional regulator